ncbi:hypothetical protein LOK49_LG07G02911 [Camellia lanceoleosa]|uniref:Uncharacterized protein n=1 Tax=Camellia lanceoleosa TaxID=1840588 RepID=A0ACC0H0H0_9ERIC|nr:hypothetical protein LOK49_LG07G02911 [Camellia lanceoleosa]
MDKKEILSKISGPPLSKKAMACGTGAHGSHSPVFFLGTMAKERKARFVTEVAPPKLISVTKRPLTKMLDTIAEEERDFCTDVSLSSTFGRSLRRETYREVSLNA